MKAVLERKSEEALKNNSSIWKNKQFLLLISGTSVSNLTFSIFTMALPIMIYELTRSAFAMGTMRAIEFLPNLLLAVFIGVLVDRFNRKKVLLSSVGLQMVIILTMIALLLTSQLQLWHLYVLGFILYTSAYMFGNAYHSVLPLIVEKEQLTAANSVISFLYTFVGLIGPALAGMVLLVLNNIYGLTITAVGLLVLLLFISLLKLPVIKKEEGQKKTSMIEEMKEGWYSLIENKELWNLTIMVLLSNITSAATLSVFIFFALDVMNVIETKLGIILASTAIGGLVAATLAKKMTRWFTRGQLFIWSLAIQSFGYFLLFFSLDWYWLVAGMFCNGLSGGLMNIHYFTLRQETTPNHLLGRVAGTSSMLMKLAVPFAFFGVGALAEFIPVHFIFLGSAIGTALIIVYLVRTPVVYMR
ncbi:MAG: MFS transporter [Bacillaceae bacterium]|nr:MFS transporter [Bacillaceae bacterium]